MIRLLEGNALTVLRTLPARSVHVCVCSPPYHGLRSYGTDPVVWALSSEQEACEHDWVTHRYYVEGGGGTSSAEAFSEPGDANAARLKATRWKQDDTCAKCGSWSGELGAEPTIDMHIAHLIAIFREVRRVLRDDGTFWLNYGDRFANDSKWGGRTGGKHAKGLHGETGIGRGKLHTGLHDKELIGLPWMLAFALRADGWRLRQVNHWCKTAPMPESVTDRTTSAVEYIFHFWKGGQYYYDQEAVREKTGNELTLEEYAERTAPGATWKSGGITRYAGANKHDGGRSHPNGRNLRNWWQIGPDPFPLAHYATFPKEIPRRAILAGTSEKGCCPNCGAPWVRVVEKVVGFGSGSGRAGNVPNGKYAGTAQAESGTYDIRMGPQVRTETTGWRPGCTCDAGDPVPATVLDPFVGSGTSLLVADRLGRDGIGIELLPANVDMARKRIYGDAPLFAQIEQVPA